MTNNIFVGEMEHIVTESFVLLVMVNNVSSQ